jgi:hypothetical protein
LKERKREREREERERERGRTGLLGVSRSSSTALAETGFGDCR